MEFITENERIICRENDREVAEITFPETEKNVFDINHTFVDESMQGKGIAAQLVRRAINEINLRGGEIKTSCSYARKYVEKNGIRPYVICHMMTSIDGKVTGDFLYTEKGTEVSEIYYEINRQLKGDAFACGRVTMEAGQQYHHFDCSSGALLLRYRHDQRLCADTCDRSYCFHVHCDYLYPLYAPLDVRPECFQRQKALWYIRRGDYNEKYICI